MVLPDTEVDTAAFNKLTNLFDCGLCIDTASILLVYVESNSFDYRFKRKGRQYFPGCFQTLVISPQRIQKTGEGASAKRGGEEQTSTTPDSSRISSAQKLEEVAVTNKCASVTNKCAFQHGETEGFVRLKRKMCPAAKYCNGQMQMERKKKSHRKKIFYLGNVKWTSTNSDFEEGMEKKRKNKGSIKNSLGQSP